MIINYFNIAKKFWKHWAYGLGLLFVRIVFIPILAFDDSKYLGKKAIAKPIAKPIAKTITKPVAKVITKPVAKAPVKKAPAKKTPAKKVVKKVKTLTKKK